MTDELVTVKEAVNAMSDSVAVIDKIRGEPKTLESIKEIIRNIEHLEVMLAKDPIKNSSENLQSHQAAVSNGKSFLGVE